MTIDLLRIAVSRLGYLHSFGIVLKHEKLSVLDSIRKTIAFLDVVSRIRPEHVKRKEENMAFVSKKDLIEKLQPLVERLSRLRDELDALNDEVERIVDEVEEAIDEADE